MDIADRIRSIAAGREHHLLPSDVVSGDGQRQIRVPYVPKLVVELVADQLEQERASHMTSSWNNPYQLYILPKM